jgi:protein-S-isoprenylcysteine O-methyltransferase Ste14
MPQIAIFIAAVFLVLFAYLVFRILIRRDYFVRGHLSKVSSTMQLLLFIMFFSFPYLFNPPGWALFWIAKDPSSRRLFIVGLLLICSGFLVAFGTMAWFGIGRAFGLQVSGLVKAGPYRMSRNPQILGGYLLVLGTLLQNLSICMVVWVVIYVIISHWMVITEEEHLHRIYGDEYEKYCAEVPRYIFI